jgi:CHAT domain-containing protein
VNLQENQHSLGETLALRTFNIRDSTFSNLPGSKEEVLKSAEYFNKESTKTLIGKEASEDAVRHSISKAKIIHLSSHSYINIYNPDLSFIALSQPDTAFIISEDGLLFASEIAQEQYAASLVVLASCESGVGYYLANNGMWSLARYFMQVGVPNIVFTRWRIADKPTTKLMLYFFEYVSEGIPYAQALQKAQLEYLETAPNTEASPYFWGSFTAQCKYSK